MKIRLHITYNTNWGGQALYVFGSTSSLGNWDEDKALEMTCVAPSKWFIESIPKMILLNTNIC